MQREGEGHESPKAELPAPKQRQGEDHDSELPAFKQGEGEGHESPKAELAVSMQRKGKLLGVTVAVTQ